MLLSSRTTTCLKKLAIPSVIPLVQPFQNSSQLQAYSGSRICQTPQVRQLSNLPFDLFQKGKTPLLVQVLRLVSPRDHLSELSSDRGIYHFYCVFSLVDSRCAVHCHTLSVCVWCDRASVTSLFQELESFEIVVILITIFIVIWVAFLLLIIFFVWIENIICVFVWVIDIIVFIRFWLTLF